MTIDRAERTGFGVALGGHILLFALLSAGFMATRPPLPIERKPVEVSLVDETALESGAPTLSDEAPAPKLAEIEGPVEPTPPPPDPAVEPTPAPPTPKLQAPAPTPTPRPAKPQPKAAPTPPAPAAKPAPAKAKPTRPTGRLKGLLTGVSDADSPSQATAPPAATVTPAVQSALAGAVRRQIKPHWNVPSGPDVESLKTVLQIDLARDGSITNLQWLETTGINDNNRAQAQLHKERAIKAVRLAAPFELPPKFYDGWKSMKVTLDWRLSL